MLIFPVQPSISLVAGFGREKGDVAIAISEHQVYNEWPRDPISIIWYLSSGETSGFKIMLRKME